MAAVLYRLRAWVRQRWRSTSLLVVLVASVTGAVLALAAGAQRTQSAPDRYTEWAGGDFDAVVTQQTGGLPRTTSVAALSAVESVAGLTFVFGVVVDRAGAEPVESLVFSGSAAAAPAVLVDGREPDPNNASEFVATKAFLTATGASIGDEFDLVTLTQSEADGGGFSAAFAAEVSSRPAVPAVLVGVVDGASQLQLDTPLAVFSPALLDRADLGISQTNMAVQLHDASDVTELRTQLDDLPDGRSLAIGSGALIGSDVRRAVSSQALGMWVLTFVTAGAAVAMLGQIITRNTQISLAESRRLSAIGGTDRQVVAETLGRAGIPIVGGCSLGVLVAVLPSSLFPTGYVRRIDPHPGFQVDAPVLLCGAATLVIALATWSLVAAVSVGRPARPVATTSAIENFATRSPSATAATGLRLAYSRRPLDRGGVLGPIIAVALGVAMLEGALVFGVNLDRLLEEPVRYGVNFDVRAGDDGSVSLPSDVLDTYEDDPGVAALTLYADSFARSGSTDLALLGVQRVRGDGAPAMTEGVFPVAVDEIALGRVTAGELGVRVGDSVTLVGVTDTQEMRVAGIAVVPGFGANEGVGEGALVTMDGLSTLDSNAAPKSITIRFEDRSSGVARFSDLTGWSDDDQFRPSVIVNVERVRAIPFVLAGLLGSLALLTICNVVVSSVRSRRRDLAILRALGADGGWLTRAVHWQATVSVFAPALAGAALGATVGRQVFAMFADGIGAMNDVTVPLGATAGLVVGCVMVANLAASIPGRGARRAHPTEGFLTR